MATITEDYVSFETAKLLKEKGFGIEEETCGYYPIKGDATGRLMFGAEYHHNTSQVQIAAPTLQMTMKWLREIHNLDIITYPHFEKGKWMYIALIFNLSVPCTDIKLNVTKDKKELICEAAIKYCLKKLI